MNARDFLHAFGNFFIKMVMVPFHSCTFLFGLTSDFPECFFFQAEDGIRDDLVTGVQTCALPISPLTVKLTADVDQVGMEPAGDHGDAFSGLAERRPAPLTRRGHVVTRAVNSLTKKIGRASCRERV